MRQRHGACVFLLLIISVVHGSALPARAQTPPPKPAEDAPTVRIGGTIFADYTVTEKPETTDVDGNRVTSNAFNVGRAYINVTGNLSRRFAYRITPDIVRETGSGSSLSGSYTFRLKYAYGQFNLDDWMPRGSWVRFGMQQTPWVDFMESVYRYRFQGTIFEDREGFLSSSDVGVSFRYNFAGDAGDVHGGFYNGETYARPETNDQKAFMVRGTVRPFRGHAVMRGLRLTGFYDHDAYVRDAERRRAIGAVTFEHPRLNAAFDYFAGTDQPRATAAEVDSRGFSTWVTPRFGNGWEGLVRYDRLEPDIDTDSRRHRTIAGVAYWFPLQGNVTTALLFDVEQVEYDNFAPARPTERRWALHALMNF